MTDWMHIGPSLRVQNLCLYDKLNLPLTREDTIFASCPYAGSIAIAVPTPIPNQSTIFIYAQNGTQLSSISASAVHSLFWSNCQKLLLVNPNGRVLVYDSLGKLLTTFSMGDETLTHGLADIKVFYYANETGLAAINSARHIFTSNSVNSPLIWRLQENSRDSLHSLSAWTVLASSVKPTQILLCSRTRFLLGQQETGSFQACAFPWARRDGQYVEMEPNKTHSQLLLLHNSNLVQIIDIEEELQTELQQIKLEQVGIEQLLWCGDLAFGLKYQSELTIYSIENTDQPVNNKEEMGANFTFSFQPPFKCATDLETIRVFGRHFVNLVLPLAQPSKAVLGLASSEPGALLYGAAVKLEQHSYVAYEFIRSININDMPIAVEQCLAAAAHNFDPKTQKQLLKAASMGMRRCDRPFDSDKFVRISRILRVLNALRLLGFPLTFTQLEELSPPSVIDRLVSLGHWPMAVQFCDFLALDTREGVYKVLAHWCRAMMAAHKQRADGRVEELTQRLVARLKQYPAISYADIAEMASRQELSSLANTLLDMETNISRQVTVMLKFKQLEKALQTAAQSQQPDLMHLVLRHLRNNSSGREVETMLRKVPQALNIYLSEIRDEAPDRLLALYNQNDDFIRQTILYLHKAEQSQDVFDSSRTTEQLAKAEKALRSVRESASAQLVAESAQLVADNMKREEKYGTSMSHMSVRETFFWAAAHEELALMEQLKKQFRLGEKQVFFWTVEGYARGQKWQQLEQFGRSRKSPMGYLSIIDLCAVHGNKNVATKFMDRLAGYEEQVQAYLAIGEVKKAATLAAEKSDLHTLQLMKRRFPPSSPQWVEVSKIMETLAKPK